MTRLALALFIALPLAAQTYSKDVVPIFNRACAGCHGEAAKLGGLDLRTYESLQQGGKKGKSIVPGHSADSRLFLMVTGGAQPAMPMAGDKLAAGDIETLRRWIDAGAKDDGLAATVVPTKLPVYEPRKTLKPQVFSLAYSPDGKLLALGGAGDVRLIDVATHKTVATLTGHSENVRALAFSLDSKFLAAAAGKSAVSGEVKIWDVAEHRLTTSIAGHRDAIYSVAFSPDGKQLATSSYDRMIVLWDPATGKEIRTLKDHIDAVYSLAFTPDGKRLLSGAADRTIKVWDPATGERLFTLGEPADGINAITIDPTGKMVAAAGQDKSIRIWALDAKAGRLLNSLIAHEDAILKIVWSPDGKLLVSASADKTIKVFRAADLTEVKTITPQSDWVNGIAFTPDGKFFAAGRYDGSLSIYDTTQFRDHAELINASR